MVVDFEPTFVDKNKHSPCLTFFHVLLYIIPSHCFNVIVLAALVVFLELFHSKSLAAVLFHLWGEQMEIDCRWMNLQAVKFFSYCRC
jgi:hypothetical protein